MNFITVSFLIGLIIWGVQSSEQRSDEIFRLTTAIHHADVNAGKNTDKLVQKTIEASDRNFVALQHRSNITNAVFAQIFNSLNRTSAGLTQQHQVLLHALSPNSTIINRQVHTTDEVHEIKLLLENISKSLPTSVVKK